MTDTPTPIDALRAMIHIAKLHTGPDDVIAAPAIAKAEAALFAADPTDWKARAENAALRAVLNRTEDWLDEANKIIKEINLEVAAILAKLGERDE